MATAKEALEKIKELNAEEDAFCSHAYPDRMPDIEDAFEQFLEENGIYFTDYRIQEHDHIDFDEDGYVVLLGTVTLIAEKTTVNVSASLHGKEWDYYFDSIEETA